MAQNTSNQQAYLKEYKGNIPIAFVCTPEDLIEADEAYKQSDVYKETHVAMQVPTDTLHAIEEFHKSEFMNDYHTKEPIIGDDILHTLSQQFSYYQVPIGLLPKLLDLRHYALHFIMDDSGSMSRTTDSERNVACNYMKEKKRLVWLYALHKEMTRWEEAEDRLHVMMDILAYLPIQKITISFLNRPTVLYFERHGASPSELAEEMHHMISNAFLKQPEGGTPIYGVLERIYKSTYDPTAFYLFTDGEPSDKPIGDVVKLVLQRKKKEKLQDFPMTFVSCTNNDKETEWMKDIDEQGPYIAEVDDFEDEGNEVMEKQGESFLYTRGIWLCCLLVGAMNPDDLDALDDRAPISKYTMENVMGREMTLSEYKSYWNAHPFAKKSYNRYYEKFVYGQQCTREILNNVKPVQTWMKKQWHKIVM